MGLSCASAEANLPKEQIGDMSVHPVQHLSDAS